MEQGLGELDIPLIHLPRIVIYGYGNGVWEAKASLFSPFNTDAGVL
jgi:hypothetical protein